MQHKFFNNNDKELNVSRQAFSGTDKTNTPTEKGCVFPFDDKANIEKTINVSTILDHHNEDICLAKHTEAREVETRNNQVCYDLTNSCHIEYKNNMFDKETIFYIDKPLSRYHKIKFNQYLKVLKDKDLKADFNIDGDLVKKKDISYDFTDFDYHEMLLRAMEEERRDTENFYKRWNKSMKKQKQQNLSDKAINLVNKGVKVMNKIAEKTIDKTENLFDNILTETMVKNLRESIDKSVELSKVQVTLHSFSMLCTFSSPIESPLGRNSEIKENFLKYLSSYNKKVFEVDVNFPNKVGTYRMGIGTIQYVDGIVLYSKHEFNPLLMDDEVKKEYETIIQDIHKQIDELFELDQGIKLEFFDSEKSSKEVTFNGKNTESIKVFIKNYINNESVYGLTLKIDGTIIGYVTINNLNQPVLLLDTEIKMSNQIIKDISSVFDKIYQSGKVK